MDPDTDQRSRGHDQNQVNVGNLFVGIEDGYQEEPGEGARERDSCDLGTDDGRPSRALVRIGQMPLASGTGGHSKASGNGATITQAHSCRESQPPSYQSLPFRV